MFIVIPEFYGSAAGSTSGPIRAEGAQHIALIENDQRAGRIAIVGVAEITGAFGWPARGTHFYRLAIVRAGKVDASFVYYRIVGTATAVAQVGTGIRFGLSPKFYMNGILARAGGNCQVGAGGAAAVRKNGIAGVLTCVGFAVIIPAAGTYAAGTYEEQYLSACKRSP